VFHWVFGVTGNVGVGRFHADTALPKASRRIVQRRYRAIARHYSELADREERADKTRMAERLRQLRLKREEVAVQVRQSGEANDNLAIGLLRLMQIRARRRRSLQRRWCSLQNQV